MGSWFACPCGNRIHKNLFAGCDVRIVVRDSLIDSLDETKPTRECIDDIVAEGDVLVRCSKCGRIAIEDSTTGDIAIYVEER